MHDDGDYHGTGRFVGIDGTEYQGEWNKGKRHGKAVFYTKKTGIATVGLWESDKFIKYISHKVVSEKAPGEVAEPLAEGFDWNAYRGIVPHSHDHADPVDHGNKCAGCDHDHHKGPISQTKAANDHQSSESRNLAGLGVSQMEEEKMATNSEPKLALAHHQAHSNQDAHHHHHDGRACNHKH